MKTSKEPVFKLNDATFFLASHNKEFQRACADITADDLIKNDPSAMGEAARVAATGNAAPALEAMDDDISKDVIEAFMERAKRMEQLHVGMKRQWEDMKAFMEQMQVSLTELQATTKKSNDMREEYEREAKRRRGIETAAREAFERKIIMVKENLVTTAEIKFRQSLDAAVEHIEGKNEELARDMQLALGKVQEKNEDLSDQIQLSTDAARWMLQGWMLQGWMLTVSNVSPTIPTLICCFSMHSTSYSLSFG